MNNSVRKADSSHSRLRVCERVLDERMRPVGFRSRDGFKVSIREFPNGGQSHTIGFTTMGMSQPRSLIPFFPQIPLEITEYASHHTHRFYQSLGFRNQEPNSPRKGSSYCLCNPHAFCFDIQKIIRFLSSPLLLCCKCPSLSPLRKSIVRKSALTSPLFP